MQTGVGEKLARFLKVCETVVTLSLLLYAGSVVLRATAGTVMVILGKSWENITATWDQIPLVGDHDPIPRTE